MKVRQEFLLLFISSIAVGLALTTACKKKKDDPPPTASGPTSRRVFLTSQGYNGNLGGLSGADAKCQALVDTAVAAGVAANNMAGTTWKAYLSDSNTNAIDRLAHDVPYHVVQSGTKIFNNKAHIALNPAQLLDNIDYNEKGQQVSGTGGVWTGTEPGAIKSANTCQDWGSSSSSLSGTSGAWGFTHNGWTSTCGFVGCDCFNNSHRLYCFEQ